MIVCMGRLLSLRYRHHFPWAAPHLRCLYQKAVAINETFYFTNFCCCCSFAKVRVFASLTGKSPIIRTLPIIICLSNGSTTLIHFFFFFGKVLADFPHYPVFFFPFSVAVSANLQVGCHASRRLYVLEVPYGSVVIKVTYRINVSA